MKATLFDFNGVLVDDENVHLASFREVLAPLGVTIDDDAYAESYLGFDDAGAFAQILEDADKPASSKEIARLVEAKKPVYMRRIATDLVVFEGAADIVRRRAELGIVGIVSGALEAEIVHALEVMGVREHVSFIVSAERTSACKPDPEGYFLGLAELSNLSTKGAADVGRAVEAGHVVVIEDSLAGIEAAKSAGLRCAAVAHSYPVDRLLQAGADVAVERLAQLTDAHLDDLSAPPPKRGSR